MKKNIQQITNSILRITSILGMLLLAIPAFAQSNLGSSCTTTFKTLTDLIDWGTCMLNQAVLPLLITLALIFVIVGIVKFIVNMDNEEARKQGKNFMIWGVVSLFVIMSVWGLVAILGNTFGIGVIIPQLPTK